MPDKTIRALTDDEDMTIAKLPEELREDVIVLEITYASDQTDTKALTVTLQDNGQFFAKFVDYKITDADTFVRRPDAKVVPQSRAVCAGGRGMTAYNGTKNPLGNVPRGLYFIMCQTLLRLKTVLQRRRPVEHQCARLAVLVVPGRSSRCA